MASPSDEFVFQPVESDTDPEVVAADAAIADEQEDELSDYLTSGLGASIVSAGVGMANSGVALGNSLGLVDSYDESAFDESQVVGDVFGQESREFYERHKEGIDMAGFVLGTVVPGALAIKGLRAAQLASGTGRLTNAQKLATGLDNPDLILGSRAVQTARATVLGDVTKFEHSLTNPKITFAYMQGLKQNAIEAVTFELAAGALNNKNSTLDVEGLNYWESYGHFIKESIAPGMALGFFGGGIAIGTAVDALRIKGYLERSYRTAEVANNFRNIILPKAIEGAQAGDQLDFVMRQWKNFRTNKMFAAAPDDAFAQGRNKLANAQYETTVKELWQKLGKGNADTSELLDRMIKSPETYGKEMTDIFSNGLAIRNVSIKEMDDSIEYFNKTAAQNRIFVLSHADPKSNFRQFNLEMKDMLDSAGLNGDEIMKFWRSGGNRAKWKEIETEMATSNGLASPDLASYGGKSFADLFANGDITEAQFGNNISLFFSSLADIKNGGVGVNLRNWIALMDKSGDDSAAQVVNTHAIVPMYNRLRTLLGLPEVTEQEYKHATLLHELGHAKSNGREISDFISGAFKNRATDPDSMRLASEIIGLSVIARPETWGDAVIQKFLDGAAKSDFSDANVLLPKVEQFVQKMLTAVEKKDVEFFLRDPGDIFDPTLEAVGRALMKQADDYLIGLSKDDPRELLADAVQALTAEQTAEMAKKFAPNVAKVMDKFGAIQESWKPNQVYFNARNGRSYQTWIPGLRDMTAEVKVHEPAKKGVLTEKYPTVSAVIKGKTKTYKYDPDAFDFAGIQKRNIMFWNAVDVHEYDAMWMAAQSDDLSKYLYLGADGQEYLRFKHTDIPHLERMVTRTGTDGLEDLQKKMVMVTQEDGTDILYDLQSLEEMLSKKKISLRDELVIGNKFNENQIAKMLNMDVDVALYGKADVGDVFLLGKKDFTKPEVFSVDYGPVDMNAVNVKSRTFAASNARMQLIREQRSKASALALGENYRLFQEQDLQPAMLQDLSSTMVRQGMFTSTRAKLGSVEEKFTYIGTLTRKCKTAEAQKIEDGLGPHFSVFNRSDAAPLRAELAMSRNMLRRNNYYLIEDGERTAFITKEHYQELAQKYEEGTPAFFNAAAGRIGDGSDQVFSVGKEVGNYWRWHMARNAANIDKKLEIGKARGYAAVYDKRVVYSPPPDLRNTPYFLFVVPTEFMRGADSRKFMVYAQTAEELAAKRSAIEKTHGKNYKILSQEEVSADKKLLGEYKAGHVFNEIAFDHSLAKIGTSAEIAPNLDLTISNTLEELGAWHHRQAESIINSAVELQFADVVENLKSMDKIFTRDQRASLFKQNNSDSVYEFLRNTMLDEFSEGSNTENLWMRVNDFVGELGSKVLDSAYSKLNYSRASFDQKDLDAVNEALEAAGYNPPFRAAMEAIASSPDIQVRNSLPRLVRTMNNFSSTFQIRLDGANWIVQTVSTPILTSGVLLEAQRALKGTAAGAKLQNLTTVPIPGTTLREPTAAKMMGNATAAFWSKDGKKFLNDLKDRGIIGDYLQRYLDAMDFSELNGSHTLQKVNNAIDKMGRLGGEWSPFKHTEEFSRFVVAHSAYQMLKLRGVKEADMWPTIASMVDKVHGQYRATQRPTLFRGVVGQSIGLYQTYMLNFLQNATQWVKDGQSRSLAITAGLQGTIFGLQSFPGFQTLNSYVAEANNYRSDMYDLTGTSDQNPMSTDIKGYGQYFVYGLGSHIFGTPVDFATRGDMTLRNSLVFPNPASFESYPAANLIVKAVDNGLNSFSMINVSQPSTAVPALVHGMAHNGFSRPLQGLGQLFANEITSKEGKPYFLNSNYIDYDMAEEFNYGATFARLLGTKPLNETILMTTMFNKKAYQAESKKKIANMAGDIQARLDTGMPLETADFDRFLGKYQQSGGSIENFNTFMTKQLAMTRQSELVKFQRHIRRADTRAGRIYKQMNLEQSTTEPWAMDAESIQAEMDAPPTAAGM